MQLRTACGCVASRATRAQKAEATWLISASKPVVMVQRPKWPQASHRQRRRAGLRIGAGSGPARRPVRQRARRPGWSGGKERGKRPAAAYRAGARLHRAADQAGPVMRVLVAALVSLAGTVRQAVADFGPLQGVGSASGRRPRGSDRCKDLHRQRDQDDRKEFLELPPHRGNPTKARHLITVGPPSRAVPPPSGRFPVEIGKVSALRCRNTVCRAASAGNLLALTILPQSARPPSRTLRRRSIRNHYENCSKFEQSLPKMMTRQQNGLEYWLRLARGSSLVVQVSGGALARRSSVAPPIKIKSRIAGK